MGSKKWLIAFFLMIGAFIILYFSQRSQTSNQAKNPGVTRTGNDFSLTNPDGTVYYGNPTLVHDLPNAFRYFVRNGQWQDAETTIREIIEINQQHNDLRGVINSYSALAMALQMQGKLEQALYTNNEQLKIASTISPRNPRIDCDIYTNRGVFLILIGRYEDARKSLMEARRIAQENELSHLIPDIDNNIRIAREKLPAISKLGGPIGPQKKLSKEEIELARKAVRLLKDKFGNDNPVLNLASLALEQSDFPGVVGEEGAVVSFDEHNIPIRAVTTRVYCYETGKETYIRNLTDGELRDATPQLREYYQKITIEGKTAPKTVVILSNSFKLAACEAILNTDTEKEYSIKREERVARMYRQEDGQEVLIAAEEIFY